MSNFGICVSVSSSRFSLICLDNSLAVLFSASTASSEGADGSTTVIGGVIVISEIMVIGSGLGLPKPIQTPLKYV